MSKRVIEPNTTLYPVGVVLVTTGGDSPNALTCNRLASCSAEPPRLALSVRRNRYSYELMRASREFVVNLPTQEQLTLADYLGVVSGRDEDKIAIAQLQLAPARRVKTPLLADCPVNIECAVEREIDLDSHALFIGLVQAVHAEESLLDANGDVEVAKASGIVYGCGTVRERPTDNVRVDELRRRVNSRVSEEEVVDLLQVVLRLVDSYLGAVECGLCGPQPGIIDARRRDLVVRERSAVTVRRGLERRRLRELERQGVRVTIAHGRPDGTLDLDVMRQAVTPGTRLVVVNHASNVMGAILPVAEIGEIAHQAGALLLVDTAQTAGVLPIDVEAMGIDLLAFTGHKGLQGPPGTGGLVIGSRVEVSQLAPLVRGGTGSRSEFEQQPEQLPDRYESGTPNGVGLAGLGAGMRWVLERGVESIRAHEVELATALVRCLRSIPGITLYGPADPEQCTAVMSRRVEGKRDSEIGWRLDEELGIVCRVGLH